MQPSLQLLQVLQQLAIATGAAVVAAGAMLSVLRTETDVSVLSILVWPAYDPAQTTKQETKLRNLIISTPLVKNRPRTVSIVAKRRSGSRAISVFFLNKKIDNIMLDLVLDKINQKYPFANVSAFEDKHKIELETVKIPEEKQNSGVGSDIIRMLQDYAKRVGKPIVIRPEADKGKKEALNRFYKKLGFVKNSGRNMDYTLSSPVASTMYWRESFKNWLFNIENIRD